MASRMEKYKQENEVKSKIVDSRSSKNKDLYDDFYNNASYTEFVDVKSSNFVELGSVKKDSVSRENYHKTREFKDLFSNNEIKEEEIKEVREFKHRDYDFNKVIEEAKKNREVDYELEKKRKLKVHEYDILSDLSEEKLRLYKEKKKEMAREEKDDLEELINTITSKTLKAEVDDIGIDLMDDLMPSSVEETIIDESLSKEILEKYNYTKEVKQVDEIDHSFYTKSMDLSKEDFEIQDTSFVEEKNSLVVLKLVLTVIALIILIIISIITLIK